MPCPDSLGPGFGPQPRPRAAVHVQHSFPPCSHQGPNLCGSGFYAPEVTSDAHWPDPYSESGRLLPANRNGFSHTSIFYLRSRQGIEIDSCSILLAILHMNTRRWLRL